MQKDKKSETGFRTPPESTTIMFASDGPHLSAEIGDRLGTAPYLLLVDPSSGEVEALPNPGATCGKGGGLRAAVLAIEKGVPTVITRYCSPSVERLLQSHGIQVIQKAKGTISDWVQQNQTPYDYKPVPKQLSWKASLKQSTRQFYGILPLLLGIIGLIGLFNAYVSRRQLMAIFSGKSGLDTFLGSCMGSILAGNPINSYVIGGSLLKSGVSLYAVTAFMVAWVSVGLIQLPMEAGTLGHRFAIFRNLLTFLMSMGVAFITVACVRMF